MKIMCAQTTLVIRSIFSCKTIYEVNGMSRKIRKANVKKNIQSVSERFGEAGGVELGLMGEMRVGRMEYLG